MWFKLEFVMRFQIKIKIVKFIKKTHKNKAMKQICLTDTKNCKFFF